MRMKLMMTVTVTSLAGLILALSPGVRAENKGGTRLRSSSASTVEKRYSEGTLELSDYARERDGTVKRMTWAEADSYCGSRGMALPTAAILAMHSQRFGGARGILGSESSGVARHEEFVEHEAYQRSRNGYQAIYTTNAQGQSVIDFYYNGSNYVSSREPHFADEGVWTSSTYGPAANDHAYAWMPWRQVCPGMGHGFGFCGVEFRFVHTDFHFGVRCLQQVRIAYSSH